MKYTDQGTPWYYRCFKCGARRCKLWRQYQALAENIDLLCITCAERDQKEKHNSEKLDTIGWLVAAVPTEDSDTFWGFTSIPQDGCDWWDNLPTHSGKLLKA